MPEDRTELGGSPQSGVPSLSGNLTVRPERESPLPQDEETPPRLSPIERVRFRIAVGVLCGFFGLIAIPTTVFLVAMFAPENRVSVDDLVRVVTTLSAATSGLAGAVVGYYFGQNSDA